MELLWICPLGVSILGFALGFVILTYGLYLGPKAIPEHVNAWAWASFVGGLIWLIIGLLAWLVFG